MRKLPPLNAIRAFEAAARHESFIKAAEELSVTAPAISQQVRQLEEWLKIKLFTRLNRGLALTPAGRDYVEALTKILDRLERHTTELQNAAELEVLNVYVTPGFAALWLSPKLWGFMDEHPELTIRISAMARPLDGIRSSADVAISYGDGGFRGLSSELLLRDGLTPVCAPALLSTGSIEHPNDLKRHTLLHNESAVVAGLHATWSDWLEAAGANQVNPRRGLYFSDFHLVIQEAIAGRGIGLGHLALIGQELRTGRLVRPFDVVLPAVGDYYAVYRPGAEHTPKVAAFLGWLRDRAREDSGDHNRLR